MIEPIKIDESFDNWRYGLIASLVDRDDFLQDIEQKRTRYLHTTKPFDRAEVEKYLEVENSKIYGDKTYRQGTITINGHRFAQNKYEFVARQLLKKYSRSYNFKQVISFALSCGEVLEKDLKKPSPFLRVASLEQQEVQITLNQHQAAIIFDPETNPKDIKEEINNFFDRASKSELSQFITSSWSRTDTKNHIKRDRKWYLMTKIGGKDVMDIVNNENEKLNLNPTVKDKDFLSYQRVYDAITAYEKLLHKPLK